MLRYACFLCLISAFNAYSMDIDAQKNHNTRTTVTDIQSQYSTKNIAKEVTDPSTIWDNLYMNYSQQLVKETFHIEDMYKKASSFDFMRLHDIILEIPGIRRTHLCKETIVTYAMYCYICLNALRTATKENHRMHFCSTLKKLIEFTNNIASRQKQAYSKQSQPIDVDFLNGEITYFSPKERLDSYINEWSANITRLSFNVDANFFSTSYAIAYTLFFDLRNARNIRPITDASTKHVKFLNEITLIDKGNQKQKFVFE